MAGTLQVSLWRGGSDGRYVDYDVPMRDSQTVLDIVTWVQRNADATLSYRFACRVGMCGSCAMTVNGRPRWTCRTHVSKVASNGRIKIGPLENLPVIKDLAADMQPFFEKWQRAKGRFAPSKTRTDPIERIAPDSRRPARRERCHRMHQLRSVLRRMRHSAVESRLSGPGRAQSRLDAWSTMFAMLPIWNGLRPSQRTAVAMLVILTSRARSTAQWRSTRRRRLQGLSGKPRRPICGARSSHECAALHLAASRPRL